MALKLLVSVTTKTNSKEIWLVENVTDFYKLYSVCFQLSYGPGSKLKSETKPDSDLPTSGENTSSLGFGSDASPADVVNAARKRNEGNYHCTSEILSVFELLTVENHTYWNSA